ncbi:MAG: hypothetical protein PHP86_11075 [Nevskiales bacterium]|nr:hypothetical protein [Nevskiales bacterium]
MSRRTLARGLYWAGWLNLTAAAALIAACAVFGPGWPLALDAAVHGLG